MRDKYFWPGMTKSIQKYTSSCHSCQTNKHETQPKDGILQPIPLAHEPFQSVSMDFIVNLQTHILRGEYYTDIATCSDQNACGVYKNGSIICWGKIFQILLLNPLGIPGKKVLCRGNCAETIVNFHRSESMMQRKKSSHFLH
jgi:hypothetical protein